MISPGLRIGRYEVGKRLGKGGFGVVHVARDVDLDREIAIKVLKPEYLAKPQIVQRFIQEARAAAKIGHPGIVTVFECGQIQGTGSRADGNAYIAMELLVGENLADRILNGGRMSAQKAIAIARQLAAALGAAHTAGIVHRDLKPDNVYLVPDAAVHGGERVKVLDFGVAKLIEPMEDGINTHSQMMLGTPRYMSPEQARSAASVDHRSDIYMLGCILFEMLVGRSPFTGDTGDQIIAHQTQPPPSARTIVATVPVSIDALIRRMLAKQPADRPQTMSEVVDALIDLADEPDTQVRAALEATTQTRAPLEITPLDPPRPSAEITAVAPSRVDPRRRLLFVAVAGVTAVFSAVIVMLMMRRGPAPRVAPKVAVTIDASVPDAAVVVEPPTPDAAVVVAVTNDTDRLRAQCLAARDAKKWPDLIACAEKLREVDQAEGQKFYDNGHQEQKAEVYLRRLTTAVGDGDVAGAKQALAQISEDSVYYKEASEVVLAKLPATPSPPPPPKKDAPKENPCDRFDALQAKAQDAFSSGRASEALAAYELLYKCRPGDMLARLVVAASCKGKNLAKARQYWKKLSSAGKDQLLSLCSVNGFFLKDLDD